MNVVGVCSCTLFVHMYTNSDDYSVVLSDAIGIVYSSGTLRNNR